VADHDQPEFLRSGAIASYAQVFSFSGRKTSATETSGRTASYGYDTIYRLLSENITGDPVSANNGSLGYSLDSVGNRSSLASNLAALASQSFTYDANDRISGDTFDTNGNTLTSGGHTFVYDFQDRLTQFDNTVAMVYDGDGNRVARTEGGVTHRYLIDDQTPTGYPQIAEEMVPTDGVIRQHTYGTMRISQRQLLVSPNWQLSYYGYDGGGSVRQLFNPSGAVTDTYAYDAFGNTVAQTGTTFNQFLYRGEQFDSTLGNYYLRARYYGPQTGRFLTQDKYEPDGYGSCPRSVACSARPHSRFITGVFREQIFESSNRFARPAIIPFDSVVGNRYVYAEGDPVNKSDASGLAATLENGLLAAAIIFPLAVATVNYEQKTHASANLLAATGEAIWDLWLKTNIALTGAIFASKADLKQVRDAGRSVGREDGCRAPEPDDFELVHEILKDLKGPNGNVTWEDLLDAWREVLCGGR
jgi:RHS repeat-associated protein